MGYLGYVVMYQCLYVRVAATGRGRGNDLPFSAESRPTCLKGGGEGLTAAHSGSESGESLALAGLRLLR